MLLVRRGLLANGVLAFGAMRRLAAWVCAIVLAGCGSSGSGAGGSGGASTVGLSSIKKVTLAVYGRSFATTTSGSVSWQTFKGIGASPSGGVANSTPYQWYSADATAYFDAGDGGILLRIKPGPPSDALIVNRVELCIDAT